MRGANASFRGVEGIDAPPGKGLRWGRWIFAPALIALLVGFNLFSLQLQAAGDRSLSAVAFHLLLFMAVLHLIEQAFHSTVTFWAAGVSAQSQTVPPLYEHLRRWTMAIQHGYTLAGMLAIARLARFPRPVCCQAGSGGYQLGLWVVVTLVAGEGFPVALYIPPLVMGVALLAHG